MKLIVPHVGRPEGRNARLIRLADFFGIPYEPLLLEKGIQQPAKYLEEVLGGEDGCFVVDPEVLKEWTGGRLPDDLTTCLTSRFSFLFVHGLTPEPFSQSLTRALSIGRIQSIQPVTDSASRYDIAADIREVCGPFSGISFGPVSTTNDHVFSVTTDSASMRTPISIGGKPFMTVLKQEMAETLFLASRDTVDLDSEVADKPLSEYFSRFVPHAMALRYIFGEQCWHPREHYASFIVDDPLLRSRYGYLDFGTLLSLMKAHNFCTTIAFIPHNFRKNSKSTLSMFRHNSDRLAICFHGNDHTAAEFACTDISRLNTMVRVAEDRMNIHTRATGLPCDKVMVFPQEKFSVEAMRVLKSHNFVAAVNASPNPAGRKTALTIGEFARPAILRHAGFPLFLRKYIGQTARQDIAFNLFFGRPVLVVEHHEVFKHPGALLDVVRMINSIAPQIRWCNLATAVMSSTLRRRTPNGTCHVQAYSHTINISNDGDSPQQLVVEWDHSGGSPSVEQVLQGDAPNRSFEVIGSAVRVSLELAPHSSQILSVVYRNDYPSLAGFGVRWGARAFIRRRLSEARDNYISKNRFAAAISQMLQRRIFSKIA